MSHSCNYGLWPARLLCPCGFPARILEWVAISSSRASSHPRDQIHISCIAGRIFTTDPSEKHVFWVLDPYQIPDFQIFSLFTFLMVSFETLKFYILMKSNWSPKAYWKNELQDEWTNSQSDFSRAQIPLQWPF